MMACLAISWMERRGVTGLSAGYPGHVLMAKAKKQETEYVETQVLLRSRLKYLHYVCCILLVKASYWAHLETRVGEMNSTF